MRRGARKGGRVFAAQPISVQKPVRKPSRKGPIKKPVKQLPQQMLDNGVWSQELPHLKGQNEDVQKPVQELPRLQRQNEEVEFNCVKCGGDSTCSLCSLFTDPLEDEWAAFKSHLVLGREAMTIFSLNKLLVEGEPFW